MRVSLRRRGPIVGCAAAMLVGLTACTPTPPPRPLSTTRFEARMTTALAGCGLKPGDPGVAFTADGWLTLRPEAAGHPTSVTAVTAECVLSGLRMPAASDRSFTVDSVRGGFGSAHWNSNLASWVFQDTLDFKVDVVPG